MAMVESRELGADFTKGPTSLVFTYTTESLTSSVAFGLFVSTGLPPTTVVRSAMENDPGLDGDHAHGLITDPGPQTCQYSLFH